MRKYIWNKINDKHKELNLELEYNKLYEEDYFVNKETGSLYFEWEVFDSLDELLKSQKKLLQKNLDNASAAMNKFMRDYPDA
jgi:hypothetical protein